MELYQIAIGFLPATDEDHPPGLHKRSPRVLPSLVGRYFQDVVEADRAAGEEMTVKENRVRLWLHLLQS